MLSTVLATFFGTMIGVTFFIAAIVCIVLDGVDGINLWARRWRLFTLIFLSHPISLGYVLFVHSTLTLSGEMLAAGGYLLLAGYLLLRLHFFPVRKNRSGNDRYFILYGARIQLSACGLMVFTEIVTTLLGYYCHEKEYTWIADKPFYLKELTWRQLPETTVFWDLTIVFVLFFFLCFNASLRVLITSKRLGRLRRLKTFVGLLIPGINIYFLYRIHRLAKEEYYIECCRYEARKTRKETDVCNTKYPIVLIHGIAFRDFQYINYWGRIPRILTERGAEIYYGHQQAWDTIENNAGHIKEIIEKALQETGAEKVNIIAHSKGGLDARYLISGLHMEEKVATLTTVSTPHRGSGIIEILEKLPDSTYRRIAGFVDKSFQKVGDKHPDCYHASKQLSPEFCRRFNEAYPDSPKVYYQSYASVMKCALSDYIMAIPHLLLYWKDRSPNDGLVTVESAKWGEFKKVFRNKHLRGISHVDMIDLRRDDIYIFDVLEEYIRIVMELKEKGY